MELFGEIEKSKLEYKAFELFRLKAQCESHTQCDYIRSLAKGQFHQPKKENLELWRIKTKKF